MQRTITQAADVSGEPLADLKSWLGISRTNEDELLIGLLRASLDICEGFTGQMPLAQTVEERVSPMAGCRTLASQPLVNVVSVQAIAEGGTRAELAPDSYTVTLQAAGGASFELKRSLPDQLVAISLVAGIAGDWQTMPGALKQGVIRMAAYHYRDREGDGTRSSPPPASVAALWRPWRQLRLS
ncbi:hypothetical protein [Erythrobacter sp. MTPC3]|uniref:head-tail connector protein n=1 Tax=Erythrobacter sp. MTPC3 TaxID=3056564 RepID=UPI0036F3B16E